MQNAFGEPVVYQSMQAGLAVGAPATIVVVRRIRERMEAGAVASVEEIEVNPVDLPIPVQRGDTSRPGARRFRSLPCAEPDPYGMVHLTLTLQP